MRAGSTLSFRGRVRWRLVDAASGRTVRSGRASNTVTNLLLQQAVGWLLSCSAQIGLGNGSPPSGQTGAAATDTGLWSPVAGTQRGVDYQQTDMTYWALYSLTYTTADPTGTFTEAGLWLTPPGGSQFFAAHVVLSNVNKQPGMMLVVQWEIQAVGD